MEKKLVAMMMALAVTAMSAEIGIVRDGKPLAVIVQGRTEKCTTLAVEVLQECVEMSTGVRLEVVRPKALASLSKETTRIVVGECTYANEHGVFRERLPLEEYRIEAKGNAIFLYGHDKELPNGVTTGAPGMIHPTMDFRRYSPATAWAVTAFLDRFAGVRFLWPGKLGTYCPKRQNLSVPDGFSFQGRPRYEKRHIWFNMSTNQEVWDATNRYFMLHQQGTRIDTAFMHHFDSWWDMFSETKPEVIALSPEGKRDYWNRTRNAKMCLSNPETQEQVVELWRKDGCPDMWSLCPNDGLGFCTCSGCRAMDSEETRKASAEDVWNAKVNLSRRYDLFWNSVIERMRKENQKVRVCVLGYGPYKLLPEGTKLEPALLAAVVPADFDVRGIGMQQWDSWVRTGATLELRPNWLNTFFFAPYLPLRQTADFMAKSRPNSIGYEHDCFYGCWPAQGLYCYMIVRMAAREELSVDDVVDEYVAAFGKGATAIRKWIRYWEDYTDRLRGGVAEESEVKKEGLYDQICASDKRIRPNALYGCWDSLHLSYPEEVMKPAYDCLDEARQAIGDLDSDAAARVEFLRDGMTHVDLMRKTLGLFWKAPAGRSPEFMQAFNELFVWRTAKERDFVLNRHHIMYNEFSRNIRIVPRNADGTPQKADVYDKVWKNKK
ncbi:MAG: DUF4838 domain-containing protein [Victivallales bacterium]|nr:DUF4838 domain-containing protein [Victivallales bacterium]